MSLSTPVKIKTLQRKLYTKAKQEPRFCVEGGACFGVKGVGKPCTPNSDQSTVRTV